MSCELLVVLLNAMLIGAVVGYVSYLWHEYWNVRKRRESQRVTGREGW